MAKLTKKQQEIREILSTLNNKGMLNSLVKFDVLYQDEKFTNQELKTLTGSALKLPQKGTDQKQEITLLKGQITRLQNSLKSLEKHLEEIKKSK